MAEATQSHPTTDPRSGFSSQTKTFHSLRPRIPLPPPTQPLSLTDYTLSLLHLSLSSPSTTPFLIDSATGSRLTYSDFLLQTRSLSLSLRSSFPSLSKNDVALILSPTSLSLPVLYFSLLSLGVTLSPANPLASPSELTHMVRLTKPALAFTTSSLAPKLPASLPLGTVLVDSPEFQTMMTTNENTRDYGETKVDQSDTAAILYSSGTTGRVKGVELTHRNFISLIAGFYYLRRGEEEENALHPVALNPLPLFHVFGFFMLIRAAAMGETIVLMERFDFEGMLRAVERYKVTYMPVSPPLVVALAKSEVVARYDLSSLRVLGCGGAPLGKEVAERFGVRFPGVEIVQVRAVLRTQQFA